MPLKSYSVLKCKILEGKEGEKQSPHFQIHGMDQSNIHYRIAVNIRSQITPSDLLYYCKENFDHPIIRKISTLADGMTSLAGVNQFPALDFLRGNLFEPDKMQILPAEVPGPDNDLNEKIAKYVRWAITMNDAELYAFGAAWGPEEKIDSYFGFEPGRGIHDIHMNQGNSGKWAADNGSWQDGGLFFHFPATQKWVAIFLAFQSQSFITDKVSGEPVGDGVLASEPAESVRIIAALVNPSAKNRESVTLINPTNQKIDITDWVLTDNLNFKRILYGDIRPGELLTIHLSTKSNPHGHGFTKETGIITLLDRNGRKVHGVYYGEKDYQRADFTIVF